MKKITPYLALGITLITLSLFAQDGTLDSSFGDNGTVSTEFDNETNFVTKIAFGNNGSINVFTHYTTDNDESGLKRITYNTDGSLYNITGDIVNYSNYLIYVKEVYSDGSIFATYTGGTGIEGDYHFGLKKFNSSGNPDPTFGNNGLITEQGYVAASVVVQQDGKIVVVGSRVDYFENGLDEFAIHRYNSDGTKDSSFGTNGTNIIDLPEFNSQLLWVDIMSNGKIVAVGDCGGMSGNYNMLIGYNANGTLDTTFGNNGFVERTLNPDNSWYERFKGMRILPDDKILAWGMVGQEIAIYKYNSDGTPNADFGNNGISICHYNDLDFSEPYDMGVQADGKIIINGHSSYAGQPTNSTIFRLNANGVPDNSFGDNGRVIVPLLSEYNDSFYTMGIHPDGAIIVSPNSNSIFDHIILMRFISSLNMGTIDFSSNNMVTVYPNPLDETSILEYTLAGDETITLELIDMQGKIIASYLNNIIQTTGSYKQALNISSELPNGSYMLVLSSEKGKKTIKIIK